MNAHRLRVSSCDAGNNCGRSASLWYGELKHRIRVTPQATCAESERSCTRAHLLRAHAAAYNFRAHYPPDAVNAAARGLTLRSSKCHLPDAMR